MGRRPKVTSEESFVCPVCKKEFFKTEDSKYLINKDYTCSWDCFLRWVKEKEERKECRK